jgi:hypothetical protein
MDCLVCGEVQDVLFVKIIPGNRFTWIIVKPEPGQPSVTLL